MASRLLMTLARLMEPPGCALTWFHTSKLFAQLSAAQRCWAHLLREANCLAEHVEEARPLTRALHRLYRDLNTALLEDPPPEVRARIAGNAKRRLRSLRLL